MLYGKDDTGKTYVENGNDRTAYERIISCAKAAMESGRIVEFDSSTASDLQRYEPGIFSFGGRLGGKLF